VCQALKQFQLGLLQLPVLLFLLNRRQVMAFLANDASGHLNRGIQVFKFTCVILPLQMLQVQTLKKRCWNDQSFVFHVQMTTFKRAILCLTIKKVLKSLIG
jgi:hypothetical protein